MNNIYIPSPTLIKSTLTIFKNFMRSSYNLKADLRTDDNLSFHEAPYPLEIHFSFNPESEQESNNTMCAICLTLYDFYLGKGDPSEILRVYVTDTHVEGGERHLLEFNRTNIGQRIPKRFLNPFASN